MIRKSAVAALMLAVLVGLLAHADTGNEALATALQGFNLVEKARIEAGLELGLDQGKLSSEPLMRLLELLSASREDAQSKEALLLVLVAAVELELPADGLTDKAIQGMLRGVPLRHITQEIDVRRRLELATRNLLHAKGIFSASGTARTAPTYLPEPAFDALVTHIAGALGDVLEADVSPFESEALYDAVEQRLTHLAGSVLSPSDVELALERIEPEDLTQLALGVIG